MLDGLRRGGEAGIERRHPLVVRHDLGALLGDAHDGFTLLGLRLLAENLEHLLEPLDLTSGFLSCLTNAAFRSFECAAFAIFGSVFRILFSAK